jgi:8-oxo-dGTP diphosphatase
MRRASARTMTQKKPSDPVRHACWSYRQSLSGGRRVVVQMAENGAATQSTEVATETRVNQGEAVRDTPRTYVGAYALCVREGRVLLARMAEGTRDAGAWTLPGGGLEWGEDPSAGVLRELGEETGLAGTITGIAGVYSKTYLRSEERPRDAVQHLGIVFTVDTHKGELRNEVGGTTDVCAWIPLAELESVTLVPLAQFGVGLIQNR